MRLAKFVAFFVLTWFIGQQLTKVQGPTMLYWAVTLPGTFFHELAHWTAALVLQGHPTTLSVWPTWDANGNMQTMGHVLSYENWYNSATVGLAPLLLAPFTVLFIVRAVVTSSVLKPFLYCYLAACAWASCIPSPQDFHIAMAPASWPLAALIFGFVGWCTYRIVRRTIVV